MAAPTPTARQTPVGIPIPDGFSSKITIAEDPDISFWEKQVKPPGLDGGDAIEQTTMHNVALRTKRPRSLVTMTDSTTTVAYDPAAYTQIMNVINVETVITQEFYDGTTVAYYGYLQKFEPAELKEGEQAEATITLVPTNWDYVNHVEAGPVVSSVAGT